MAIGRTADSGVYIDFSEANPASASSTNVNMFDLSEGDQTADVAVGGLLLTSLPLNQAVLVMTGQSMLTS